MNMFLSGVHTYPQDFQRLIHTNFFLSYVARIIQLVSDLPPSISSLTKLQRHLPKKDVLQQLNAE